MKLKCQETPESICLIFEPTVCGKKEVNQDGKRVSTQRECNKFPALKFVALRNPPAGSVFPQFQALMFVRCKFQLLTSARSVYRNVQRGRFHLRPCLLFCFQLEKNSTESMEMIKLAWSEDAVSLKTTHVRICPSICYKIYPGNDLQLGLEAFPNCGVILQASLLLISTNRCLKGIIWF